MSGRKLRLAYCVFWDGTQWRVGGKYIALLTGSKLLDILSANKEAKRKNGELKKAVAA